MSDITESVAVAGVNSLSGRPASLSNLSFGNTSGNVNLSQQNSNSQQQAMNQIALSVTGKAVNLVSNLSPVEAVAAVKLTTGNDLAQQILDLKASIQSIPGRKPSSSGSSSSSSSSGGPPIDPTLLPPGTYQLEDGDYVLLGDNP